MLDVPLRYAAAVTACQFPSVIVVAPVRLAYVVPSARMKRICALPPVVTQISRRALSAARAEYMTAVDAGLLVAFISTAQCS